MTTISRKHLNTCYFRQGTNLLLVLIAVMRLTIEVFLNNGWFWLLFLASVGMLTTRPHTKVLQHSLITTSKSQSQVTFPFLAHRGHWEQRVLFEIQLKPWAKTPSSPARQVCSSAPECWSKCNVRTACIDGGTTCTENNTIVINSISKVAFKSTWDQWAIIALCNWNHWARPAR